MINSIVNKSLSQIIKLIDFLTNYSLYKLLYKFKFCPWHYTNNLWKYKRSLIGHFKIYITHKFFHVAVTFNFHALFPQIIIIHAKLLLFLLHIFFINSSFVRCSFLFVSTTWEEKREKKKSFHKKCASQRFRSIFSSDDGVEK